MLLSEINQAVERKLAAGAVEFALDRYQEAKLGGSIDAQLEAAGILFTASKQALSHLLMVQADVVRYEVVERRGPLGLA